MAKTKLTPLNRSSLKTIPRIELNAAKMAVSLYLKLKQELCSDINIDSVTFWTDSVATLQYIKSESGHFQRFVANRVAYIRNASDNEMWRFVPGDLNPADILSRGTSNVERFIKDRSWTEGPDFLKKQQNYWPRHENVSEIPKDNCEVKGNNLICSQITSTVKITLPMYS